MKYNVEEFGKKIRNERKKLNLTQSKLGEKLGHMSGKQISIYETGKLIPPLDVLLDLCNIFNCELGYLLGEPDYSDGTKLETAITARTGLTKESIDNIQKITGDEKQCLEFGYCSEEYKKILNRMFSSEALISLIESIRKLDRFYAVINGSGWNKAIKQYGEDRMDKALETYSSDIDFEQFTEEEGADYKIIDKIIEEQHDADFFIKIYRYDVWENFEALIGEMFPTHYCGG